MLSDQNMDMGLQRRINDKYGGNNQIIQECDEAANLEESKQPSPNAQREF